MDMNENHWKIMEKPWKTGDEEMEDPTTRMRSSSYRKNPAPSARSQLWDIVDQISSQLASIQGPEQAQMAEFAGKLKRLKALHIKCEARDAQLRMTQVAIMRERNLYLKMIRQIESYGVSCAWGADSDASQFLCKVRSIVRADS